MLNLLWKLMDSKPTSSKEPKFPQNQAPLVNLLELESFLNQIETIRLKLDYFKKNWEGIKILYFEITLIYFSSTKNPWKLCIHLVSNPLYICQITHFWFTSTIIIYEHKRTSHLHVEEGKHNSKNYAIHSSTYKT